MSTLNNCHMQIFLHNFITSYILEVINICLWWIGGKLEIEYNEAEIVRSIWEFFKLMRILSNYTSSKLSL